MTREHKLALILTVAIFMVVGVLIADHMSPASQSSLVEGTTFRPQANDSARVPQQVPLGTNRTSNTLVQGPDGQIRVLNEKYAMANREPTSIDPDVLLSASDAELMALAPKLTSLPPAAAVDQVTVDSQYQNDPFEVSAPAEQSFVSRGETNPVVQFPTRSDGSATTPSAASNIKKHTVREGETLWSIADRYYGNGRFSEDLARYNERVLKNSSEIYPGLTLSIPTLDGMWAGEPVKPIRDGAVSQSDRAQSRSPKSGTYTVRQGDSLSLIAQRELGTIRRMDELLELNSDQLDDADSIYVGMVLKLPAR